MVDFLSLSFVGSAPSRIKNLGVSTLRIKFSVRRFLLLCRLFTGIEKGLSSIFRSSACLAFLLFPSFLSLPPSFLQSFLPHPFSLESLMQLFDLCWSLLEEIKNVSFVSLSLKQTWATTGLKFFFSGVWKHQKSWELIMSILGVMVPHFRDLGPQRSNTI